MSTLEELMKDPLSVSEEDMDRLMSEQGEEDATPGVEEVEEKAEEVEAQAEEPAVEPEPEAKPSILTRDGKHHIPYSTLEAARAKAVEAEQARQVAERLAQEERAKAQLIEQQMRELLNQRQALQTAQKGGERAPEVGALDPEILERIREEAPDLARIMEAQAKANADLAEKLQAERAERVAFEQSVRERYANEGRSVVEQAISNNPKLVFLREERPEEYNKVVEFDNFVRSQAEFKGLSIPERLAKSLTLYEAAHGTVKLAGSAKQQVATPKAPSGAKAEAEELQAPNTLSDIAGGSLPAKSDEEAFAEMSATDLTARFMDMDPSKIDKLLARMNLG